MAWLFCDTSVAGLARIGCIDQHTQNIKIVKGRSEKIVRTIINTVPTKLDGLIVVAGPGSFSAIRAGVVCANLLARIRQVPLIGVTVEDVRELETLFERVVLKQRAHSRTVLPIYDAEPNISFPHARV